MGHRHTWHLHCRHFGFLSFGDQIDPQDWQASSSMHRHGHLFLALPHDLPLRKFDVAEASDGVKYTLGVIIGVLDGLPLAATNTIPPAAIADCAQYDTIKTGERKEGMFMAVKNFCMKICQSIVLLIAPVVITLGSSSTDQMPTIYGVGINNLIAAIAAAGTIAIYAFYDEKEMRQAIDESALEKRSEAQ
jgi:hypothetical protein